MTAGNKWVTVAIGQTVGTPPTQLTMLGSTVGTARVPKDEWVQPAKTLGECGGGESNGGG